MSERVNTIYKNFSKRFQVTGSDYSKQYCALYNCRLKKSKEILLKQIERKWGSQYPICDLHELTVYDHEKCFIIGTIFKEQKLKPSVLKQLHSENNLIPQPVHIHFTSEDDRLYVEDESQRFKLEGNVNVTQLVTGITCAFLGSNIGDGKFTVDKVVFMHDYVIEKPIASSDVFIVFISGLDLMHFEKQATKLHLLIQWLSGQYEECYDQSKIVRVIIAGNSISASSLAKEKKLVSIANNNISDFQDSIDSIKKLDDFLLLMGQLVDVDLMPGENDPTNHILPQKSLHTCMLPKSSSFKSINCVSNPYDCEIDGIRIMGSSGQPVDDVMRFSDIQQPIDALEATLKWGSIAPTAPDTLACFPFYDDDPFVISDLPNVFFSGNHEKFQTCVYSEGKKGKGVRLICVPDFSKASSVAVLSLKDLSCTQMMFSV